MKKNYSLAIDNGTQILIRTINEAGTIEYIENPITNYTIENEDIQTKISTTQLIPISTAKISNIQTTIIENFPTSIITTIPITILKTTSKSNISSSSELDLSSSYHIYILLFLNQINFFLILIILSQIQLYINLNL